MNTAPGIIKRLVTCCFNRSRCPSGIPHSAAVCVSDINYILVNGKHSLIISCDSIGHHLCLLVCCFDSYCIPTLPPSDSGSRSTSGGAGEGPGSLIIHQLSSYRHSYNRRIMARVDFISSGRFTVYTCSSGEATMRSNGMYTVHINLVNHSRACSHLFLNVCLCSSGKRT